MSATAGQKERAIEGVDSGQCYAIVPPLTHHVTNSTYFLWDVLTMASFGKEDLVKRSVVNSDVIVAGASRGRTVKAENGRPVDLVYHVDRDASSTTSLDLAKNTIAFGAREAPFFMIKYYKWQNLSKEKGLQNCFVALYVV